MPMGENPYLSQWTQNMTEAAQLANHLREAAVQKHMLDEQNRRANQQLQMDQADQQQRFEHQNLATQLQLNAMGAQKVDDQGKVPSTIPGMYGEPVQAPTPDPISFAVGHNAFQNTVPAGLQGRMIATAGHQQYQLPTAQETFATGLQQKLQEAAAMMPQQVAEKEALDHVGKVPLPTLLGQPYNIPEGTLVDPSKLYEFANSYNNQQKNQNTAANEAAVLAEARRNHDIQNRYRGQEVNIQGGRLALQRQEYADKQNPVSAADAPISDAEKKVLQLYVDGRARLPRKNQDAILGKIVASGLDPEFDAGKAEARFKARSAFAEGKEAQNVKGLSTAAGHAAQLEDISDKLGGLSVGVGNGVLNQGKTALGREGAESLAKYKMVRTALTADLDAVLGGSKAEAGVERMMANLSPDQPPNVRKAAIGEVRALLKTRHSALVDQWTSTFGNAPVPENVNRAEDAILRRTGPQIVARMRNQSQATTAGSSSMAAPGVTPAMPALPKPPKAGMNIDPTTATKYLHAAQGNRQKAEALAKADGWSF